MSLTIHEHLEQGSVEWLEARRGIVTASTVGKLLTAGGKVAANDTSRGLTETLAIERITGRVEEGPYPSRDMQRGTALEPFARDLYAEHYAPVTEIGFARLDAETFTLGASPDGLVGDVGGIEIKSPRARTHLHTLLADEVPAVYIPQIQACLMVTGRAWWDFISYCPGLPLYVKRVLPDPAWHEAIRGACELFETNAHALAESYAAVSKGYHPTEYINPFQDEEIVI